MDVPRTMIQPSVSDSCSCPLVRRSSGVAQSNHCRISNRNTSGFSRCLCTSVSRCRPIIRLLFGISLCFWIFPVFTAGDPVEYTTVDDETQEDLVSDTKASNFSQFEEEDCPSCDIGGRLAGAVIGSLLSGILLGAVAMYCYLKKFQNNYEVPALPKDYDLADTRLDVNRNDDSTYESGVPTASDQSSNAKNHKKLERLVKKSAQKSAEPIEIPSAATPLIHFYECPGEDNPAVVVTPSGTKSIIDEGGSFYSNTGSEGPLSQPYESLEIIPEEVEYENSRVANYEQVSPKV